VFAGGDIFLAYRELTPEQHNLHEAVVNLTTNTVESNVKPSPLSHTNSDGEEIMAVEKAIFAHPDVQAEIAKLNLPQGTEVVSDPWIYGGFDRTPGCYLVRQLLILS
jgi:Cu2+-containing amine oxidase